MTFHILTVGDGDMSLSLALARAYQHEPQSQSQHGSCASLPQVQVQVTASTLLPCEEDLIKTYPQSAPSNLQELRERKCEVFYGVDATQLHQYQHGFDSSTTTTATIRKRKWDCIVFYHAHLGDDELRHHNNEGAHAERHYRLLAHYLASAASRVRRDDDDEDNDDHVGRVHLCLCGTQAETWRLRDAANAAGLLLVQEQSAQEPFHKLWSSSSSKLNLQACPPIPGWAASRRSRNGRAGSRDWLGKYGYRHRRTHGDGAEADAKDVDLTGSTHYLFAAGPATKKEDTQGQLVNTAALASFECHICGMKCANSAEVQAHLQAPALPDVVSQPAKGTQRPISDISQSTDERPNSGIGSSKLAENTPVHSDVLAAVQTESDVVDDGSTTSITTATATATTTTGGLQTVVVSPHNEGKRLRWYIQHCMPPPKRSKKVCELLVKDGHVFLDGQKTEDTGRILRTGVEVSIRLVDASSGSQKLTVLANAPTIRIVTSWSPSLTVVWKPVSMRTIGCFDASTLEQSFARQSDCSYKSLSKLDTGCSGLCVLQKQEISNESFSIRHTFTALLHGHVPLEWIAGEVSVELPMDAMRRWRKRALDESDKCSLSSKTPAQIRCSEQTDSDPSQGIPKLSTVTISTDSEASGLGSVISFYLRKAGYPVVGDRFAGTEYLSLPRPMRNRIKHRLSIGCTRVECHTVYVTEETAPVKWQARYWQDFCNSPSSASKTCKTAEY
jgi:hypothetical protein